MDLHPFLIHTLRWWQPRHDTQGAFLKYSNFSSLFASPGFASAFVQDVSIFQSPKNRIVEYSRIVAADSCCIYIYIYIQKHYHTCQLLHVCTSIYMILHVGMCRHYILWNFMCVDLTIPRSWPNGDPAFAAACAAASASFCWTSVGFRLWTAGGDLSNLRWWTGYVSNIHTCIFLSLILYHISFVYIYIYIIQYCDYIMIV